MHTLYLEDFIRDDLVDCTASGDVLGAVEFIVNQAPRALTIIPSADIIDCLANSGGWERGNLEKSERHDLLCRLVFVAADQLLECGVFCVE